MVEWPHCVERVCRMVCAGSSAGPRLFVGGIRVSKAGVHPKCSSIADGFHRTGYFRRDGHQTDFSLRRLPKPFECTGRRLNKVGRRMYPTLRVTNERAFQMDSNRNSTPAVLIAPGRFSKMF